MASNKPKPYRLRPRALDDLESIWLYTAKQWSVDQADIYIRQLTAGLTFSRSSRKSRANVQNSLRPYGSIP